MVLVKHHSASIGGQFRWMFYAVLLLKYIYLAVVIIFFAYVSVRPSVPTFQNIAKRTSLENNDLGLYLAEGIIVDTCLVLRYVSKKEIAHFMAFEKGQMQSLILQNILLKINLMC